MGLFVSILIFISTAQAADQEAYDCKVVKLHYVRAKKNIKKNEAICVHKINHAMLSPNCLIRKCEILKQIKATKATPKFTAIGTPDHRLCHDLGGLPQVIDYKWGSETIERSRCLSKKDASFVDTQTLVALLK